MGKLIIYALVLIFSVAVEAEDADKKWAKLRLASDGAFPPLNALNSDGELHGFDIDIGNSLCTVMNVECEWIVMEWDGLIPALNAGRADAVIASMQIIELRKRVVAFTDAYQHSPAVLVADKSLRRESWDPDGMSEDLVGAAASTINAYFLQGEAAPLGAVLKLYPTHYDLYRDLAAGRLDVIATDRVLVSQWLDTTAGSCCEIKEIIDDEKYSRYFGDGGGIALRKGDDRLLAMFNGALALIKENGEYKRINEKYFPFSIE